MSRPVLIGILVTYAGIATGQINSETYADRNTQPKKHFSGASARDTRRVTREIKNGQLFLDGRPFYIRGAGSAQFMEKAGAAGANAIRTWSTKNLSEILDKAHSRGLMVMPGIWLPTDNASYKDPDRFQQRVTAATQAVIQCKDHPALLMWGIGNELNDGSDSADLWRCVGAISEAIHDLDPNQLTTTVLINAPSQTIETVKAHASDLDLLCANSYRGDVAKSMRSFNDHWGKPFVISEWGAAGPWAVPRTDWDARIEPLPTAKVNGLRSDYQDMMAADNCLGSFVFIWGRFQNRTHTWHSLVLDSGELTPQADMMQYLWTGSFPENQAPMISSIQINNSEDRNCRINAGDSFVASVNVSDPEEDRVSCRWFIYDGKEKVVGPVEGGNEICLRAPVRRGLWYRVYCFASDAKAKASAANLPFMVVQENSPIVINGGFETGDRCGWNAWNNLVVDSGQKSGSHCMKIKAGGGSAKQRIVGLSENATYVVKAWIKYDSANHPLNFTVQDFGGEERTTKISSPEYEEHSLTFTTGRGVTNAVVSLWKIGGPAVYVDDVSCVEKRTFQ